jgi:hypothetical protein
MLAAGTLSKRMAGIFGSGVGVGRITLLYYKEPHGDKHTGGYAVVRSRLCNGSVHDDTAPRLSHPRATTESCWSNNQQANWI